MGEAIKGYAEGYYGRLLSWPERLRILDALHTHEFNTYYYAPKEDINHRYQWRAPYSYHWRENFREFCKAASSRQIQVIAGVAPGLDFDFSHLPNGPDFHDLVEKSVQLLDDGASAVSLLMDDIDADFAKRSGAFASEGVAHAALANALAEALADPLTLTQGTTHNQPSSERCDDGDAPSSVWVTPRIYADELAAEAPEYLPDFTATLQAQHFILYCGSDVVAKQLVDEQPLLGNLSPTHRMIVWDNLYANDYCPRRLFVGPWEGRKQAVDILLNPTGHVNTDCLLIDLMAMGCVDDSFDGWWQVMRQHGVPESFVHIAPYLCHPVCNDSANENWVAPTPDTFNAIEDGLWRWKTPLSREWYPYLFGLKHDLLAAERQLPAMRIKKTQTQPLARRLLE